MALSSDLIAQFVKFTNDDKDVKPSNTVHGTVISTDDGEIYVRIDGSELVTRVNKTTDVKVNDRVTITIENHTATITGNISSPSARNDRVEELGNDIQEVGILVAGKVSTDELLAETARIDSLVAKNVIIEKSLAAAEAVIVTLDTTYATIGELNAAKAKIGELEAEDVRIENLFTKYATIGELEATNANIVKLEVEDAAIRTLIGGYATIEKLESEYAKIENMFSDYATAVELQAVDAKIGSLNTDVAKIKTLTSNFISGDTVHTNFANAVIAQLGVAQIESSMIKDISAAKITSGDIITDKVNVKSQDGRLRISDQTMQISDTTRVRVQIGKDASGDYSINIWDANGKLMFSEGGLTEDAVKEQIIRNDMVKDDANISASKLDIDTLFGVINDDGSHVLKSNKIKFDETNQTLDVAFKSMISKIGGRNLIADTSLDTVYSGVVAVDSTLGYKDVWSAKTITPPTETEYVVSFDAKADEEIDIRCFFYSPNTTLTSESSTGDRRNNVEDGVVYVHITTEWKRYWVKWTQTPANAKKTITVGRNFSATNSVYIRAVKFEVGNTPTDWSPAPEDTGASTNDLTTKFAKLSITVDGLNSTIGEQSQLIEKKADGSRVLTLESNYSYLVQEIDEISGTVSANTTIIDKETGETISLSSAFSQFKLDLEGFETTVRDTYATKDDVEANITKSAETITAQTAELLGSYATKVDLTGFYTKSQTDSAIEHTANSITQTVSEIYSTKADLEALAVGARNLLLNTSTDIRELGGYPDSGNSEGAGYNTTIIPNKNEYVLSFDAKSTVDGDLLTCFFHRGSNNTITYAKSSTGQIKENNADGYIKVTLTTDWKRYWVKYTNNGAAVTDIKNVIVGRRMAGEGTGTISIRSVKLEEGHVPTDWTPAPEDVKTEFGSVRSEIQQLADSISLSVTGSLGQSATIKLTADGQTTAKEIDIDMSKVRQAFANDTTAIDISAGTVTFNSGTLLINSGNFTLDGSGNITANGGKIGGMTLWGSKTDTGVEIGGIYAGSKSGEYVGIVHPARANSNGRSFFAGGNNAYGSVAKFYVENTGKLYAEDATIKGSITTTDGILTTELSAGSLTYYYNDDLRLTLERKGLGLYYNGSVCGYVTSELIEGVYLTTSLILRIPYNGSMSFVSESTAGGAISHYKLYDVADDVIFNFDDYKTYTHHFMSAAWFHNYTCFGTRVTFNSVAYFKNQKAIGWYDKDGGGPWQMITFNSSNQLVLGTDSYNTYIVGDHVSLKTKGSNNADHYIEYCAADDTSNPYAYFRPLTTGKVTLGTTSFYWYRCYASLAEYVVSDRRKKENIINLSDIQSSLFDKLQPVQYNLIDGDGRICYGLIAQDVIASMAELGINENDLDLVEHNYNVDGDGELHDNYAISYNNLIAMLVHEVQKLKREIKTLKGE